MNVVTHIRTRVFDCKTQDEFASVLGTTQATVSRWETAGRIPGPMQAMVREKAKVRGEWNDRWFFEAPADPENERAAG